jgi:hypothetical protein
VNDNTPPPSASPPAPEEWKPLSGLALTSFLLSLVLLVVGAMGPWFILLIPLLLGAYALLRFRPEKQRGRRLAIVAVVVSFFGMGLTYSMHKSAQVHFTNMARSVLTALTSAVPPEQQDEALRNWTWVPALEAEPDLHAQWRTRYAEAVKAYGPWSGEFVSASVFATVWDYLVAPEDLQEIGSDKEPSEEWATGGVFWFPLRFEQGTVWMAMVLHKGDAKSLQAAQDELKGTDPVASFGDLRFYRVAAAEK